jgi:hypothetical protein
MLKLKDLQEFKHFMESSDWADAFKYAEKDLRLKMLELIEKLLDTASPTRKKSSSTSRR